MSVTNLSTASSAASSSPGALPRRRQAYAVLCVLFLFQTLNFFDKVVFGLSAVPMMKELSINPRTFGLIGSSFYLLFPVSGILVGLFVIGRVQVRWLLVILATIWSISQISVFFSSSVVALMICRVMLGLGEGPGLPSAFHASYDWFPSERRGIPGAVVLQGISFGLLVGSPALTYVIMRYGWHFAFLLCGLLGAAWIGIWLLVGDEGPYAHANHAAKEIGRDEPILAFRIPAKELWLNPTVLGVMIMSTAAYWVTGMAATWLPSYLQLGLGYKQVETGWILSAIYIFQSPLLLAGGKVTELLLRRGWTRRMCFGNGAAIVLVVCAAALQLATLIGGVPRLVLIAIAFAAPSLTTIVGPMTLGAIAPPAQRGSLIVVIYSANTFSALFSNAVVGWIVQMAGHDLAAGFAHAMTFTAGILLIGGLSAFALIFPDRTLSRFANLESSQASGKTLIANPDPVATL
jgi:MFS family permease